MKSYQVSKALRLPLFLMMSIVLFFTLAGPLQAGQPENQPEKQKSKNFLAQFKEIKLIGKLDAFYTLSDQRGADTVNGGSISALLGPYYQINDKTRFIFVYDGFYNKKLEFYSDDVGWRQRVEYQRHNFTPMIQINFGRAARYTVTPSLFYTTTLNKDIESSGWNGGLYNYTDSGAGLDFKARGLGFSGAQGTAKFGIQFYQRHYPNFDSLLDLATGLGIEKDEKDYSGTIISAGYDWGTKAGFSWHVHYSMLNKILNDKKVVDEDGVLSHKGQRGQIHNLDFDLGYEFKPAFHLGLNLAGTLNQSNQNFYDGMMTITINDDVFIRNYYDYSAYKIKPYARYIFSKLPVILYSSLSYKNTDYSDRRAKNYNGTYKEKKQNEIQQEIFFQATYNINSKWNIVGQWQYLSQKSNNDDERFYQYDYKLNNYSLGASYNF